VLDRWILSRAAALAADARAELADFDARAATLSIARYVDDLSRWYLRRTRRRISRNDDPEDRDAAFATLHAAVLAVVRVAAPILPFLAEELYQVLAAEVDAEAPDSVHLSGWPDRELVAHREPRLEDAVTTLRRAVDLVRTLREGAGIRVRRPLARLWLALPGGRLAEGLAPDDQSALLELLADEVNVRTVELIGDESALVDRRVRPLLPILGQRGRGAAIPVIMAAARANEVEYLADGRVRLGGHELAADEVEVLLAPRPGTAVAHDQGVVVVIDTTLTPELRAEGDARELTRAVQDLRKQAKLALDARIELWIEGPDELLDVLSGHLDRIARDVLADAVHLEPAPDGSAAHPVQLDGGTVRVGLAVGDRAAGSVAR
jgi:isoleucyl-tRNA synthetase